MVWFWVFMLLMILLIPLTMIVFGIYFLIKPPKEIKSSFGYRTSMSMKNRDTWEFAHKCCGRMWFVCGTVMLPVSLIVMLFSFSEEVGTVGAFGAIVCFVQFIPVLGSIFLVERALKKAFDDNGNRR